ncbi:MAG: site-2 protease family protein [bacterium]
MGELIVNVSIYAVPVLLAITVHEFFHGYVACKLGDNMAKLMGRLTLNPLHHIELFGTVLLPLMLILIRSPFLIAWAKPVPINPLNFKRPYRDMALASLAGPFSNLVMCIVFIFIYKMMSGPEGAFAGSYQELFFKMSRAGFYLNFTLFAFNLLPVPPLDGSRVLLAVLPGRYKHFFERVEPYGFLIIMLLIVLRIFDLYMAFIFKLFISILGGFLV